jgi:pimeloyl-ACP methyl ester carboxylesterase
MPTTNSAFKSGYAPVNGLEMYYEIHGEGGVPLVLLHGAFSAIGSSFGALLPALAATRQVIGVELQAHGRTADIDRPLRIEFLADDVAAFIRYLNLEKVDLYGYSNGGFVALNVAVRSPELVRKLIIQSVSFNMAGIHPGLMDGLGEMKPEMMYGSPWHQEYTSIAPHPEDFDKLFAKKGEMDRNNKDIPSEAIRALKQPVLIIIGDSDLVRPEHAVEFFRLVGGGVFGDSPAGMPDSQLAIIPGASHVSVATRAELLVPIVTAFLDKPMPAQK